MSNVACLVCAEPTGNHAVCDPCFATFEKRGTDLTFVRRERDTLAREHAELVAAAENLVGEAEYGDHVLCALVHHVVADRHGIGDPCPVIQRYRELLQRIRDRESKEKSDA